MTPFSTTLVAILALAGRAAPTHSPRFELDESSLALGVRLLASMKVDYQATAH